MSNRRFDFDAPDAFWPVMHQVQKECLQAVKPGEPFDELEATLAQSKVAELSPKEAQELYEFLRDKKITLKQYFLGFRELIEKYKDRIFLEKLNSKLEKIQQFQESNPVLKAHLEMTQTKLEIPEGSERPSL